MLSTAATAPAPAVTLDRVRQLYQQGLCLQAYQVAQTLGPLREWTGSAARVLAGRLAIHLGAPRLTFLHHLRAWRDDRTDPEACYYHARALLERRGPLRTWEFLRRQGELPEAPAGVRADWLAFHACVLGRLRDFDAAETWLARAEALAPGRAWLCIERSLLLEAEDHYEESLAAARQSLALHPWYRPGVQSVAHILQLLDRDREALDLLTEGAQRLESGLVVAQLAMLQTELGQHADAQHSYERLAELSPLLDRDMGRWLAARRSDAACYAGDYAAAAERARELDGEPFYTALAERLERTPQEGQRLLLPVGFVRQHFQTCAPATLAAVSRFWTMPAEHLDIAAEICYDGTPAHSERRWAEEHGWLVRELTVTRDSARALLDRGVPFTLTMVEATFAHLQAAIGHDSRRDTLLVRDPYQRYFGEYPTDSFLQRYRATGPRGMVLVPRERAELLDGLDLPDAGLYDLFYREQQALHRHERAQALEAATELEAAAPGHRLAWQARRTLAQYDADPAGLLVAIEGLLALFPDDGQLQLTKVSCLRELARREERMTFLKEVGSRPGADPVFWQLYAQELAADAREHPVAARLLRRFLRARPGDARCYAALADVLWAQRDFEKALELYRWAACLEDKDEGLARTYFQAARYLRQTTAALDFLRGRFRRFGARSGQPARTLTWALDQLGDTTAAFTVLEEAQGLRPDDADLRLYAAETWAAHGDLERGAALLAAAEAGYRRTSWLRAAALLALWRGELAQALGLWRQVLAVEPLALDGHREVARLLAETQGRAAALEHLAQACARFPHHLGLHQLWVEWLREDGPAAVEPVVRQMVENHPADAWAHRELALALAGMGHLDEGFAELTAAQGLDPASPSYFTVRAYLSLLTGRREEAKEDYRQAIRLSVDNEHAIIELIAACDTQAERREALAFVELELVRQVIFGNGLLTYRDQARFTLDAEELLTSLRAALAARPDLWHAWSAVIRQLTDMGRLDEALDLARQATARFPLLPALWLDLGLVYHARKDSAGEVEAARHALQISPGWGVAARQLADVHRREGRLTEARALLEDAARRTPLDALTHGWLAELLWQLGEKEPALERVQQALRLSPAYQWAWGALRAWAAQLGKPEVAVAFARDLTQRRGGEARSWLMLARMLARPEDLEERLAALDRALALHPRLADAHDLRAELLAQAGRFDEAAAACAAPVWEGRPPLILRGRAAWLEAQRGRTAEAIRRMKAVLAEDPEYFWGWDQLAIWQREIGTPAEYQEAATMLIRLAPQDPVGLGYLGEAQLRAGDRAAAKVSYRRSVELSPDYAFGWQALFDAQLADDGVDDAAQTLALLRQHVKGAHAHTRAVQLAVKQEDWDTAGRELAELCVAADAGGWPLETASRALVEAGQADLAEQVFMSGLGQASTHVHPQVGALWVDRRTARRDWRCLAQLDALALGDKLWEEALMAYVKQAGASQRGFALRRCMRRYSDRLRASTVAWGMVGYALTNLGRYRAAAGWLADYAGRADTAPWMLINLVIALRALGRDEEAAAVGRRALELPPALATTYHRLWLTLDDLLAGREIAADPLRGTDPTTLDPAHRYLHELVQILADVGRAEPAARRQAFAEARRRLKEAAALVKLPAADRPAVLRAYRRGVRWIAWWCGGVRARLWGLGRWLWPLLPPQA
jgi:tetratricopeptide (TPR) repeat protein